MRDRLRRASVPKMYLGCRFANYRPERAEQFAAKAAARETTEQGKNASVLLCGDPGCGKTHLAVAALTKHVKAGMYGLFLSAPMLIAKLKEEMATDRNSRMDSESDWDGRGVIGQALDADILLLDDLGAERLTDYSRDQIYTLLDARYSNMQPTIITSNLKADVLRQHVGERMFSRLAQMCRTVEVVGEDYRMRTAAQ